MGMKERNNCLGTRSRRVRAGAFTTARGAVLFPTHSPCDTFPSFCLREALESRNSYKHRRFKHQMTLGANDCMRAKRRTAGKVWKIRVEYIAPHFLPAVSESKQIPNYICVPQKWHNKGEHKGKTFRQRNRYSIP